MLQSNFRYQHLVKSSTTVRSLGSVTKWRTTQPHCISSPLSAMVGPRITIRRRRQGSKWDDPSENSDGSAGNEAELPIFAVRDGAASWVQSLLNVEMQCSIVSYLEEYQLNVLLEQAGLDDLLGHRVSARKGYPTFPNKLLGAALRMGQRLDHCACSIARPSDRSPLVTWKCRV